MAGAQVSRKTCPAAGCRPLAAAPSLCRPQCTRALPNASGRSHALCICLPARSKPFYVTTQPNAAALAKVAAYVIPGTPH